MITLGMLALNIIACWSVYATDIPPITKKQADEIGAKIWHNECGKSVDKLVWWNVGENFASLGIGHFIWFPENGDEPFTETFPLLLSFMQKKGQALPAWLTPATHCPWKTRDEFLAARGDPRIAELRSLLQKTLHTQVEFMISQLAKSQAAVTRTAPRARRRHIEQQFKRLTQTPQGLYALIDYTNFKGDGTNKRERYNNQGWGLLQVLNTMHESDTATHAVAEFAHAAQQLLTQRVHNAPPERNEQRWLPGWLNRLKTYVP